MRLYYVVFFFLLGGGGGQKGEGLWTGGGA